MPLRLIRCAVVVGLLAAFPGCGSQSTPHHARHVTTARHHGHPTHHLRAIHSTHHIHATRSVHHHAGRAHHPTGGPVASKCNYRRPGPSGCGSVPPPGSCDLQDHSERQDPHCTPGATDPAVTQSDLGRTICRPGGYTDSVRPPTSYTGPLELELLRSYGLPENSARTELDHLIALELGGAPDDPRNLFPEPYAGKLGATAKDALENRLHDEVCAGAIKLRAAQSEIVHWMRYAAPTSAPSPVSGSEPVVKPEPGGHCVSGYSPCIGPGPDVDCQGGSGDGPRYVQGPIRVSGSDPYQLDSDGNGVGC